MADSTTTEYHDCDDRWRTETGRADWLEPDQEVSERERVAFDSWARRAQDLRYSVGWHALPLTDIGFEVDAFDLSRTELAEIPAKSEKHGLSVGCISAT